MNTKAHEALRTAQYIAGLTRKIPNNSDTARRALLVVAPEAENIILVLGSDNQTWDVSLTLGNFFFKFYGKDPIELGSELHRIYDVYNRGKGIFPEVFNQPNKFERLRREVENLRPEIRDLCFFEGYCADGSKGFGATFRMEARHSGFSLWVTQTPVHDLYTGLLDDICNRVRQLQEEDVQGKINPSDYLKAKVFT